MTTKKTKNTPRQVIKLLSEFSSEEVIHRLDCYKELLKMVKKLHEDYAPCGKGYWVGTGQAVERLIVKAESIS